MRYLQLLKIEKGTLLFLLLAVIIHIKLILPGTILAYGDLTPLPPDYKAALDTYIYAWDETSLGIYITPGFVFPLIQALFIFFTQNQVMAQALLLIMSPMISYFSLRAFLRNELNSKTGFNEFIVIFLYTYAPVFLGEFIGGSLWSTIISFYLFPYVYHLTLLSFKKPGLFNWS